MDEYPRSLNFEECFCPCHNNPKAKEKEHVTPCCFVCKKCGMRVKAEYEPIHNARHKKEIDFDEI
ncbi:MAG: hypothetical protein WC582_02250 [Patescibacteria group bacterium]|jgi:hypothetical protein